MSSTKQYVGVAPLTMARTEVGGYVQIYAGDPVPAGLQADDLKRLLDEGFLGEAKTRAADDGDGDGKPTSVKDILADVGEDKAKAQQYLDEEKAAEKPRPSLVEKLQGVVDA